MDMLISNKLNQKQERSKKQRSKSKKNLLRNFCVFFLSTSGDCRVESTMETNQKGHRGATN